jgi:hypothetical protein
MGSQSPLTLTRLTLDRLLMPLSALSTTDRLGLNTNRVLINIRTYVLDLNSYIQSWTMTDMVTTGAQCS